MTTEMKLVKVSNREIARQMAALKGVAIAARMLVRQCQPTNGGLHRLGQGTLLALASAIDAALDEGVEIQDRRTA